MSCTGRQFVPRLKSRWCLWTPSWYGTGHLREPLHLITPLPHQVQQKRYAMDPTCWSYTWQDPGHGPFLPWDISLPEVKLAPSPISFRNPLKHGCANRPGVSGWWGTREVTVLPVTMIPSTTPLLDNFDCVLIDFYCFFYCTLPKFWHGQLYKYDK